MKSHIKTAKMKLPLHESSFVKATTPFYVRIEVNTPFNTIALIQILTYSENCYNPKVYLTLKSSIPCSPYLLS